MFKIFKGMFVNLLKTLYCSVNNNNELLILDYQSYVPILFFFCELVVIGIHNVISVFL